MEYVYFIKFGTEKWYKVGRAKNPQYRKNQLQIGSPRTLTIIKTIKGRTYTIHKLENLLHQYLFKYANHIRGEWYFINPYVMHDLMQFQNAQDMIKYLKKCLVKNTRK